MDPTGNRRLELAKLCSARNWSKAIRVLDSFIATSPSVLDLCNRAFCYSKLELHKHVVKDCDRAIEIDQNVLQAYILKGKALLALERKEDALLAWEQGHEIVVYESTDLKQLLELEELLSCAKKPKPVAGKDNVVDAPSYETKVVVSEDNVGDSSSIISSTSETKAVISEDNAISSSCQIVPSESEKVIVIDNKSEDIYEFQSKTSDNPDAYSRSSESIKRGRKLFVTDLPRTKSISLDFRLSRGIALVNDGNYDEAVAIFNQILRENATYPEALIGRGTAYAFQRELDAAISDFTKAIQSNAYAVEAWKRRGQAHAALGEFTKALEDLTKALEFKPNSSDILHERGIVNFKFKDFNAAVEDLKGCLKQDKTNNSAYTYLGLALSAIGEYDRAEEAYRTSIQLDENFLDGWAHLAQFYLDLAKPKEAFYCLEKTLLIDERFPKAYHLRGLLYHGMGEHRIAIKDLSTGLSVESSNIECLYLRASCYHAIGEYKAAVKDYDAVLDLELDSMDKFVLQCLAFYQKEIALYTASRINSEFCWFDIDGDIDPLFKEYWCKRLHPKQVCEKVFRQPPLRESLRKGCLSKQDSVITKTKQTLLHIGDAIGQKIQYFSPGFLPNRRQYRMAGLAAIEIAQKVAKAWRFIRNTNKNGKKPRKKERLSMSSQNRGGVASSTSGLQETSTSHASSDDKYFPGRSLSWQDVYSLAVKWRQISEPRDPVVWINKLSEEFNSGFGSHTPMLLGQAKVIRYFSNHRRALDVAKTFIKETKIVNNAADKVIDLSDTEKIEKIALANSCSDLYSIVGEDFWVGTSCESTAFEEKRLEGTRITLQKAEKLGFDFAIRTPCTPARWAKYSEEMMFAWEAICNAYCGEVYGSNDLSALESVMDAILRMTYYWYNFMPLSRGSAVVGYVVLLGLFLAANMEVTTNIPEGVQVDWDAILSSNPDTFLASVKPWLYPSVKINTAWKDYPDVSSTFSTTGSVVAALSSFEN